MQGEEGGSLVQGVFRGAGVGSGVKRPSPWGRAAPNDVPTAGTLPGWGTGVRCGDLAVHAQHFGVQIPTNFCTPFFCSPTSAPVTQLLHGEAERAGSSPSPASVPDLFFGGRRKQGEGAFPPLLPPQEPPPQPTARLLLPGRPSRPFPPISPLAQPHVPKEQTLPWVSSSCSFPPGLDVERHL